MSEEQKKSILHRKTFWIYVIIAVGLLVFFYRRSCLTICDDTSFFKSPERTTRVQILSLSNAVCAFQEDCKQYPPTGRLNMLFENPGLKGWSGPYLERDNVNDGWDRPFRYYLKYGKPYLVSVGKDGIEGTEDDIVYHESLTVSFYACLLNGSLVIVTDGQTYLVNPSDKPVNVKEIKITGRDTNGEFIFTKPMKFEKPRPPKSTGSVDNGLVTLEGIANLWVECDKSISEKMQRYEMSVEKFEELLKTGRL